MYEHEWDWKKCFLWLKNVKSTVVFKKIVLQKLQKNHQGNKNEDYQPFISNDYNFEIGI